MRPRLHLPERDAKTGIVYTIVVCLFVARSRFLAVDVHRFILDSLCVGSYVGEVLLEHEMGDRPRLTIRAQDAVKLIRSGWTDAQLMQRFNISAGSVERLFDKLVQAKEISRAELEERLLTSQRSHIVDIVSRPVAASRSTKRKVRINASEAVACIRSHMSDLELMGKYNLSSRGLDRLFRRLVHRGDIGYSELEERRLALQWAEIAFLGPEGSSPEPLDEIDTEPLSVSARIEEWRERNRAYIAAALGVIAGIVLCSAFVVIRLGTDGALNLVAGHQTSRERIPSVGDPLTNLANQMIIILDSVTREDTASASSLLNQEEPGRYGECLRGCDRQYSRRDDIDNALWIQCRKSCVLLHSDRMRRIRELYHYPAEPRR